MYELFTKLLNMSLTAGILVLIVLLLRFVLKKAPRKYICILWALVALRLICPFSISSALSAYNMLHQETISGGQVEYFEYNGRTEKPELTFEVPSFEADASSSNNMAAAEAKTHGVYLPTVVILWVFGVLAMLAYAAVSYRQLRGEVRASLKENDNIYVCDEIGSPFILGVIRPRIYLPSGISEEVRENVVAHEQAHIKRLDHIWKPFGFALLSVYWFNPLMWVAYLFLCRDIEAACDEKVISQMDRERVVNYSQALLICASQRRMITACPVAFGETDVKGRIKNVLHYKKPAFWIVGISVIVCIVVAVCFLTNPKEKSEIVTDSASSVDYLNDRSDVAEETEATIGSANEEQAWDYPVKTWAAAQESGLDFMGWRDVCSPSEETVKTLSTERLAWLAVRYPLFPYMPSGATPSEADIFIGAYAGYSPIFRELLTREDRNACILKEFAQNELDVALYNSGDYIENESIWIENFVQQYLLVYSKTLTSEEREDYLDAVKTKTAKYYSRIEGSASSFGLTFDENGAARVETEGNGDNYEIVMNLDVDYSEYTDELLFNFGGNFFLSDTYEEPVHGDYIPEGWYSLGGVGSCIDPSFAERETFENGKLTDYAWYGNHMVWQKELLFSVGGYSCCMYQYSFDMFTAPDLENYPGADPTSEYWVVFYTEGEGQPLYIKFFNCDYFTKEQSMENIAPGRAVILDADF